MKQKTEKSFGAINEKTHPIGIKSWLVEWRATEKYVLGLVEDAKRQIQLILKNVEYEIRTHEDYEKMTALIVAVLDDEVSQS